ncbi:MAG: hypothetical protein MHM6MM_004435 [Cercozoa sp. M6MM]
MINTAPYTTLLVAQCSTFGPMKCVITVGTTKFDDLVRALDEGAEVFVSAIVGYGIDELIIQHGASERPSRLVSEATRQSLRVTCFDYDSRVPEMLSTATLVVCHAGAGTLLETLRAPTRPHCVCVVNTTLQNNHQTELADTLSESNHVVSLEPSELHAALVSSVADAKRTLQLHATLEPLPQPQQVLR